MTASRPSLRDPAILLATWFGAGYLPKAPGTWGSLAALPFAWALLAAGGPSLLAVAALLVSLAGWWAADRYMAASGTHDPGQIVVDEVAGQWLALLGAPHLSWWGFAAGFLLFRLFDIVKPWPVSWADRKVPGGLGVMLDDVLAGVMAALALAALHMVAEAI